MEGVNVRQSDCVEETEQCLGNKNIFVRKKECDCESFTDASLDGLF